MLRVEHAPSEHALRVHGDVDLTPGLPPVRFDFAVNLNSNGTLPELAAAVRRADLGAYPEPTALPLRQLYARLLTCQSDQLIFASGAADLLWSAAAELHKPDEHGQTGSCVMVGPTFSEYASAAAHAGAKVIELRAEASHDFIPELGSLISAIVQEQPRSVYLCNPNNPTGVLLAHGQVQRLVDAIAPATLVLDESFLSLTLAHADATAPLTGRVLRVRSLTKEYCLAGLRLGYAWGQEALIMALESGRAPWATSAPAQAAGLAIPGLQEQLARQRANLETARIHMQQRLSHFGFRVFPGSANFCLVQHQDAQQIGTHLRQSGLRVRDCTSFGIPDCLRIAVRPPVEQAALFEALEHLLKPSR